MLTDKQEILIDKHFRKELSDAERLEFEKQLEQDQIFKETVENQAILVEGLEIIALEQEIKGYMQELKEAETKIIPLWKRSSFIGIAASFLILAAITSYAGYKFGWFEGWFKEETLPSQETEQVMPEDPAQDEQPAGGAGIKSFYDSRQLVEIHTANETEIEGGLGTTFRFPKASLLDEQNRLIFGKVKVELIEILDAEQIRALVEGTAIENEQVIKAFYILPYHSAGPIQMSTLSPPRLVLPEDQDARIYYGGEDIVTAKWQPLKDEARALIKKPTAAMDQYKRFIEGRIFLDSLQRYYILDNNEYKHRDGRGMTFTTTYVKSIENMINSYLNDPYFKENILKAQTEWRIYNEQHSFGINRKSEAIGNSKPLYQPGWYAVIVDD